MSSDLHFRYLSNDQLFLINTLNTMYNDNSRLIQQIVYNNSLGYSNTSRIVQEIISSNNNIIDNITRTLITINRNNNTRLNNTQNTNSEQNSENTLLQQEPIPIPNTFRRANTRNLYNRETNNNSTFTNHPVFDNTYTRMPGRTSQETDNAFTNYINNFFSPVQIYPTQTQIENATRIVRYSDIISPNNNSCPISLEPFRDDDYVSVIRFCSHIFNTEQLNIWFQSNCRCPVCRYDIRNYSQSNNNNYRGIQNNYLNNIYNIRNTDASNNNIDASNNNIDVSNNNIDVSNNDTNMYNNMDRLFINATNSLSDYLLNSDASGNNTSDLFSNEITTILLTFPYVRNNTRFNNDRQQ